MKVRNLLTGFLLMGCAAASAQDQTLLLTPEGVGCIQMGMDVNDIPAICEGLYNKVEKESVAGGDPEDFEAEPAHDLYRLYQGKVKAMEINVTQEDDGIVRYITVFSPHIHTAHGLHPGSPIEELLKQADIEWQIEGEYYGAILDGSIAIELKSKYLTPSGLNKYEDVFVNEKEPTFTLKDFKPGSKIEEISVFLE